jgi:chromosomal replication initiation ATPase DnaA
MGKTHLMHAIGHTIKKRNPAMRLSYVSAEKAVRCDLPEGENGGMGAPGETRTPDPFA